MTSKLPTSNEILEIRKSLNEKFGTQRASEIWFDYILDSVKQKKSLRQKIKKVKDDVKTSIESLEQLNSSHRDNYEKSGDTSYLHTISRNNEVLDYLIPLQKMLRSRK